MNKREEIRGLLGSYLFYEKLTGYDDDDMDELLRDLSALGVVIKVDRELPKSVYSQYEALDPKWVEEATKQDVLKAGYVATEPLVEE